MLPGKFGSDMSKIQMLDCTLRDGAYIVDSNFGDSAIKGIISKLQEAKVDIIECGWLKNKEHSEGSSFFHVPADIEPYLINKDSKTTYVAMIDWDRYDLDYLPLYDGKSIDAIRVVFPHDHFAEGIAIGKRIIEQGYKVYFQAANTLAYSEDDLIELAKEINDVNPVGISIVDTFGAMYEEDLDEIVAVLHQNLNENILLGFHSHNNQQMAYANAMHFTKLLKKYNRDGIVDASLCGMGRGAGNATSELVANYLNTKCDARYELDAIMDAIDIYMTRFMQKYRWGYSTPYYIAGIYCCHVNNIAYLQDNHRTCFYDMRNIIESLNPEDRLKYDYDLLEEKYIVNQDRNINDNIAMGELKACIEDGREILLIAPGKSSLEFKNIIDEYIDQKNPLVIAVNALLDDYKYDYLFVTNKARYEYAKTSHSEQFLNTQRILLSSVKSKGDKDEMVVNFSRAIKRGWPHFDNAVICCLRLLNALNVKNVTIVGFDGFKNEYNKSYADESLPTLNPEGKWDELNDEIKEMFDDVRKESSFEEISFLTDSIFE